MANEDNFHSQKLSVSAMAKVLGITDRRLRQLHAEGIIPRAARGRYQLDIAVQAYQIYKDTAKPRDSEHARLARAQAFRVELENQRSLGELVPAELVHETLQCINASISQQPAGQAGRLANELANINDASIVRQKIIEDWALVMAAIRRVQEERATALESIADRLEDSDERYHAPTAQSEQRE
jgi:hypothetical protein